MAVDLRALRTALVTLDPSVGVYAYVDVPANPEFPCAYAGLPDEIHDFSYGGSCVVDIAVTVAVSRADEGTAQTELGALLSPVIEALLNTPSVEWSEIAVVSVNNFRAATFGEVGCLAADINLSLRTT